MVYPKIHVTLTKEQLKIVEELIGTHGKNKTDVVNNIVFSWLEEKGYLAKKRRRKLK